MLTPAQLERHNRSITGSKIGAILGVPSFSSKFQVFAEMSGLCEPEEFENERMRMGIYAEEMIDAMVKGEYGWETRRGPEDGKSMEGCDHIWCLVDRLLIENGEPTHTLEYKNIDGQFKKNWDRDGVPLTYEAQARLQGMCWNLPSKLVAVFGGNTHKVYDFPRDEKIESWMLNGARQFWRDLQNGNTPEPDGSDATKGALGRIYPKSKLDAIEYGSDIEQLIFKRETYRLAEKQAKELKLEYENKLKLKAGNHEAIKCPGGSMFRWKSSGEKGNRRVSIYIPPELIKKEVTTNLIITNQ